MKGNTKIFVGGGSGRKVGLFESNNKTRSLPQKETNYNQRNIPKYGRKDCVEQTSRISGTNIIRA